jgi:hypothetical protein
VREKPVHTARIASTVTLLLLAALPVSASAKCGPHNSATYSDISDVKFERFGCGGLSHHPPTSLGCSMYWVVWPNFDDKNVNIANYSQFTLPGSIGSYAATVPFEDVQRLLEKYKFFELDPLSPDISDVRDSVLTVQRCSVLTRLAMKPIDGDPATTALFKEFDTLVEHAKKRRLSTKPQDSPNR